MVKILCHASSNLCAFNTKSLVASVPELKTYRSASSANINAARGNIIPDIGVRDCVVAFLL